MGVRRETQQSGQARRSEPEMEEIVAKLARRRSSRYNPKGGELDPGDDGRRRCKKNHPSVLSCISKRTKEGVTVVAKSRQFTAARRERASFSEKTEGIWKKREA